MELAAHASITHMENYVTIALVKMEYVPLEFREPDCALLVLRDIMVPHVPHTVILVLMVHVLVILVVMVHVVVLHPRC